MSKLRRRPDPDEDDDFEVVDDPPPRKRKLRPVEIDEDDDEPLLARVVAVPDDDDEPVRVPRKKKKKKRVAEEPVDEPGANEWIIPLVLMGIGLVMTLVGTIGIARGDPEYGLSAGAAVAVRLLGQVIAIPVTIVALIGIGTVMGIEYGTLTSTIRNLAAMGLFMGGLLDVFEWMHLPWFVYQPIMLILGLGLLMSLFGLDVDEAMATMVGLNLLAFLLKSAIFILVMMIVHKEANKGGSRDRPTPSDPPGWVDPNGNDPDDDPVPAPPPKGKGKNRPPVMPIDPDD